MTFGLAIVLQEIVKYYYGANQIPTPAPEAFIGSFDFGALIGMDPGSIIYPYWRIVYFCFAMVLIGAVFAFLQFTTFGMVVRAGMADRETVGLLGINIDRRFTVMFGIAAAVAGLAGVMYTPLTPKLSHGHGFPCDFVRCGCGWRHGLASWAILLALFWVFLKALRQCAK